MNKFFGGLLWAIVVLVFGVWAVRGQAHWEQTPPTVEMEVALTPNILAQPMSVLEMIGDTGATHVTSGDVATLPMSLSSKQSSSSIASMLLAAKVTDAANGHIVFVDYAADLNPDASAWPRDKVDALAHFYDRAVREGYAGRNGFGSVGAWAAACKVSKTNPVFIVYDETHSCGSQPTMKRYGDIVVITYGKTIRTMVSSHGIQLALHELAHVWDSAHEWRLSAEMSQIVQNPHNYPTAKARDEGAHEDFAESVTAYLWPGYAVNVRWSDDESDFNVRYDEPVDGVWVMDRHDYVGRLFEGEDLDMLKAEAARLPISVAYSDVEVEVPPREP